MLIVEAHRMFHPNKMVLIGRIGDAIEPRAERGEPFVGVQPPPRTDEGLLREVIAQCLVTTRLDEEVSVHRAQIPLHQPAEGTLVAKQHHTGDKENFCHFSNQTYPKSIVTAVTTLFHRGDNLFSPR